MAQISKADLFDGIEFWNKNYFDQIARQIEKRLGRNSRVLVLGTAYNATTSHETISWGYALEHVLKDSGYDVTFCVRDEDAQTLVDTADVVIIALPLDSYRILKFHMPQVLIDLWRVFPERPENIDQFIRLGVGPAWIKDRV